MTKLSYKFGNVSGECIIYDAPEIIKPHNRTEREFKVMMNYRDRKLKMFDKILKSKNAILQ